MWQGSVHQFEGPLPVAVDAVQSWLASVLTGDTMPTSKLYSLLDGATRQPLFKRLQQPGKPLPPGVV